MSITVLHCSRSFMAHVYFWHSFKDSGFPARVNHAAAPIYDSTTGKAAIISVGGYHADVQERLNTPDENRMFKSTPIDMHKLDPGKFQLNQDCKMGKVTKCCWVCICKCQSGCILPFLFFKGSLLSPLKL